MVKLVPCVRSILSGHEGKQTFLLLFFIISSSDYIFVHPCRLLGYGGARKSGVCFHLVLEGRSSFIRMVSERNGLFTSQEESMLIVETFVNIFRVVCVCVYDSYVEGAPL